MNQFLMTVVLILVCVHCFAAVEDGAVKNMMSEKAVVIGQRMQQTDTQGLEWTTASPVMQPVEAIFGFRVTPGDAISIQAIGEAQNAKPLLEFSFTLQTQMKATLNAKCNGQPMAANFVNATQWTTPIGTKTSSLDYAWCYPKLSNLWDERQYKEIGDAYVSLMKFDEKVFTLRMVLTQRFRQIWLDDRLVAEERVAGSGQVHFSAKLSKAAKLISADFSVPVGANGFLPLTLNHYSHDRQMQESKSDGVLTTLASVPMILPRTGNPDLDLGQTLYRSRLAYGGYVNAQNTWPGSFVIDPAVLTFRVPYRQYQNVWLLAWVDDKTSAVAKGTLRFFRQDAGYPASSDFEISTETIRQKRVTRLSQKTADGRQLYLIKVPVNTNGFYGLSDMADHYLEFEITKPVALARSYPDPIFYRESPAGLPSSIHVVGITMEEAPFGYKVEPKQYGFVFEQPEKPSYSVTVTNTTGKPIEAKVVLTSKSFDGGETNAIKGKATIEAGKSGNIELSFDLKKLGWHELHAVVEANGITRENTLSMVLLPPNTRTYGYAANETRFGVWPLHGHYDALMANAYDANERILAMYRKLGLRRVDLHPAFMKPDMLKRLDFLNKGPHVDVSLAGRWKDDPDWQKKAVDAEVAAIGKIAGDFPETSFYYGAEWHIGKMQYAPWPRYTGQREPQLTDEERKNAEFHTRIFTMIGKAVREKYPQVKLILPWGWPLSSIAYMQTGMSKELVDAFGMDAPQFELLPEVSNVTGSINSLWQLREEAKHLGWPRLPIRWIEGPFFPTCPGALSETQQAEYQLRYWLLGLAYGVDQFEAGVVVHDAGNYYGAEHYGAGIFHRLPLENPKPAAAVVATATTMLCGADPIGGVDTGCLTTYCMAFQKTKTNEKIFALWRVNGSVETRIKVKGSNPVLTDSMGNAKKLAVKNSEVTISLSSLPVWLTGVKQIEGFSFAPPIYDSTPEKITRPLVAMTAENWKYDSSEDKLYATNNIGNCRVTDENLKANFNQGEKEHADAVSITLLDEPSDRPLANRYGALIPAKPITIPGKASALGLWVKGNSSWGRVIYQLRDAKGEIWTAIGTRDDWNCDDSFCWSYVNFEGWRYVRFPLPWNHPYDSARNLEMTWWNARGGDHVVDLPLTLEKIIVEARNEVLYLGQMKKIPERSYKLSGLVAEYENEFDASPDAVALNAIRKPIPQWVGPQENPIARLTVDGAGDAPAITQFVEPSHFNDGLRMHIRFAQQPGMTYKLYLSRYEDGRGADLIVPSVTDNQLITGLRPETQLFLFLTTVGTDKKESKPSKAFPLITHDNFMLK